MTRSVLLASVFVFACFAETSPAAAANVALLMPGSSGIVPGDFRVRNEGRFRGAGIRTIMTTSPSSAAEAVAAEIAQGRKIVMVGMSKGTVDVASALASGARPTGVVFVSGIHSRVIAALGSPGALPATLVVHHSQDACRFTSLADASRFVAWTGGKARISMDQHHRPAEQQPLQCAGSPWLLQAGRARGFRHHFLRQVALTPLRP